MNDNTMKEKRYICNDLEATCYERDDLTKPTWFRNEIIEIGAVMCNQDGDIIDEFAKFLKPRKHPVISTFCEKLTTITQDDIDDAEPAAKVLSDFFAWAEGDGTYEPVYVSWGHYDKLQFRDDLHLNGMNKDRINDSNHHSLKHLHAMWHNLKKGMGLGSACKYENIVFEGVAHRGICDARMVHKIFKKYINKFK